MDKQAIAQLLILWIACSSYFGWWLSGKDSCAEMASRIIATLAMPLVIFVVLGIVSVIIGLAYSLVATAIGL